MNTENIKKALNYLIETEKNHYDESLQSEPELMEQTGHIYLIAKKALEELKELEDSVCGWTIQDVMEQAESLDIEITEDEAKIILKSFEENFDPSDGFTIICNALENLQDNRGETS